MTCAINRVTFSPTFSALVQGVPLEKIARRARRRIIALQSACQGLPDGQRMDESPPLKHWLAPGIYAREIHLSANTVVVGKIHRHRHLNIISKGCVTVFTEFGEETLTAPASFESEPGTKRVVFTHQDAIWTTIHPNPTNEKDVSKLEVMFVADDYSQVGLLVDDMEKPCLIG